MRLLSFSGALLAALALGAGCYNPALFTVTGDGGFYCHPNDNPACPDGTTCMPMGDGTTGRCLPSATMNGPGGGVSIPKMGSYTGPMNDPMLSDASSCPDKSLEPNDDMTSAVTAPAPMPDQSTPKITKMAICPTGPNPATGLHDVDYFKVETKSLPAESLTLKANVYYDVSYGDLDVAIFDSSGKLLASDGSAVSNGCVAASIMGGGSDYYVVVVGANNKDVNRYDIRIASFTSQVTCDASSTPDGGT